jgi:iron(III) transport system ATP-binding protein
MSLKVSNISKKYSGGVVAADSVYFNLEANETLALIGKSGCGKTTLLRIIAGFEVPDSGSVTLNGKILVSSENFVKPQKRKIGLVFQDHSLFPHRTVLQNIKLGLKKGSNLDLSELIKKFELSGLENRYPFEISGGQSQRVALARTIASQPELILLDEPLSNLDEDLKSSMRKYIKEIITQSKIPAILVTHDISDANEIADKIYRMNAGKIVEQIK